MGDDTREHSERYNPGRGDCGPYSVGQVASDETPSAQELANYRQEGVEHVLQNPNMVDNGFWVGDTPEERASSRQDWAERMRQPGVWADYALMLGMRAVFCSDAIIVQPRFPDDESNRELKAYGQDVLVAGARMILYRGNHFVVLDEVGRGGDGGSGEGNGREPSSSSSNNSSSGSSGSSGGSRRRGRSSSGSGATGGGGSKSSKSRSSSRSRSRSRGRNSSGGSSSGSDEADDLRRRRGKVILICRHTTTTRSRRLFSGRLLSGDKLGGDPCLLVHPLFLCLLRKSSRVCRGAIPLEFPAKNAHPPPPPPTGSREAADLMDLSATPMTCLQIPDNVEGGLGHSGQSAESARPRKKQRRADKVGVTR